MFEHFIYFLSYWFFYFLFRIIHHVIHILSKIRGHAQMQHVNLCQWNMTYTILTYMVSVSNFRKSTNYYKTELLLVIHAIFDIRVRYLHWLETNERKLWIRIIVLGHLLRKLLLNVETFCMYLLCCAEQDMKN